MIPIYKQEKNDNLEKKITANASVAYDVKLEPYKPTGNEQYKISSKELSGTLGEVVKASEFDDDLYYCQSILVTSCWNKNDDVFDKAEVWVARHTPEDKPTNLEHDEKLIVGHITGNWPMDTDGNILSEGLAIDELPDIYHIVTSSVIYNSWDDEELKSRAETLIDEIEAGKKFVSMECFFRDFDYVIGEGRAQKIVARNEETAFLTKHLRAYGGSGTYDGKRIGRLLRRINFSGKGFVDKPANPDSIIFDQKNMIPVTATWSVDGPYTTNMGQTTAVFPTVGVSSTSEDILNTSEQDMSIELLQDQVQKLEAEIKALLSDKENLQDKLAKSNVETFEGKIKELESQLEKANEKIESLQTEVSKAAEDHQTTSEKLEETQNQLVSVEKEKAELDKQLDEIKSKEKVASRVSLLIDGGYTREEALSKAERFSFLDDDNFEALVAELKEARVNHINDSATNDDSSASDDDTDDSLENVEPDDSVPVTAGDTSDEDAKQQTRAGIAELFESRLVVKK